MEHRGTHEWNRLFFSVGEFSPLSAPPLFRLFCQWRYQVLVGVFVLLLELDSKFARHTETQLPTDIITTIPYKRNKFLTFSILSVSFCNFLKLEINGKESRLRTKVPQKSFKWDSMKVGDINIKMADEEKFRKGHRKTKVHCGFLIILWIYRTTENK